jgi:hypothetical protein
VIELWTTIVLLVFAVGGTLQSISLWRGEDEPISDSLNAPLSSRVRVILNRKVQRATTTVPNFVGTGALLQPIRYGTRHVHSVVP